MFHVPPLLPYSVSVHLYTLHHAALAASAQSRLQQTLERLTKSVCAHLRHGDVGYVGSDRSAAADNWVTGLDKMNKT